MIYFARLKVDPLIDAKSKSHIIGGTSWKSRMETKKDENLSKEWLKKVQFISTVIQ